MRLALVQVSQETDTFNPEPTTLDDFRAFGVYTGEAMLPKMRGMGTVGGYLDETAAHSGIETLPIVRGNATAGGRITLEAFEFFSDAIRDGLVAAGDIDGLALHLHGACSAEGIDDVDGLLITMCRQILGANVPIVVTLDHHANVTQQMVDGCDAIVGYRTQPHDPVETGRASTTLLIRLVSGTRATMAWRKIPLLSHQEQYLTKQPPMKTWFDLARDMETERGVLSVSTFPMQPWLDVEEAGWATVVVTDGDRHDAKRRAGELADLAWSLRDDFQLKTSISPDDAVLRAAVAPDGVVVISDTGDSMFGGSAGDSTVLLESILRLGIESAVLIPMVDRGAVATLAAAGAGATVTLDVGGCTTPFFEPLAVTGVVRGVSSGAFDLGAEGHQGREVDMGATVIFEVAPVTLMISELRGLGGNLPSVYRHFGVEPADYQIAVLKTASNFQYFAPITSEVIRADTPGPTQSNIAALDWVRVPRPIYPIDDHVTWPMQ